MGLRTASVRHPHAEVMAPALTESNQAPNFKLPPPNAQSPVDETIGGYALHAEDPCVKGGKELSNALDNLNTLALATELLKENGNLGKITGASGAILESIASAPDIMSQSSLPMGDQDDKMGLQRVGLDNVLNLLKDKPTQQEMDQIMNLDIGHENVDEIMQVIKSMESTGDRLTSSGNDENILTELTGNLSSFEKDLFNDVDVMNMSIEEPLIDNTTIIKETQTKELMAEVRRRQMKVERKLEFLLRRLRKTQVRYMGQHFSSEVAGVFEHVHRTLRRLKDNSPINIEQTDPNTSLAQPLDTTPVPPEKMKPISSSSAKNLVRKLEMSSLLQSNVASRRHSSRYFGSGSAEPNAFRPSVSGMTNLVPWVPQHKQDLQRVSGLLHTELSLVQQEVDSEATASSSGGESCDEMQNYSNPHQQYLSIQKRASWKYLQERASIASRWTWLQAQISDLEYRIRQHSELHKNIRNSKGPVQLGHESPPRSLPSSPTTLNGYRGQLPGDVKLSDIGGSIGASGSCKEYQCARTRPLINFRKRKLLQTTGLHAVSKKAARPSTIRCGCTKPAVPCALCTGRTDPTHPRDPSDYLSKAEKVAMLDPGFHPVFSLPEDCSAGIHLEAIMKTPDWQQRSSRSTIKGMKYITKGERIDKITVPLDHRSKKLDHRKKYSNRLLKPSTVNALTAKIKNKFNKGRKTSSSSSSSNRHPSQLSRLNKKRHPQRVSMGSVSGDCEDEELEGLTSLSSIGKYDSPSTSPLLATQSISGFQRRNRVDSYDIDNIVIPYSVAASTRVEKLQYKEILTPKWRIIDLDGDKSMEAKNNGAVKNPSQDSDIEDLSEEAVLVRHDKCEHEEKKKFLSYLKLPLGYGRSRSHKRTDSRAESSGANTPDPMSPHTGEPSENMVSPLTSPPATPLSVTTDDNSNMSSSALRKRTVSQSRFSKEREVSREDTARCSTPEHLEVIPYDRRSFPLSEDTYEKMLKSMPENHKFKTNIRAQDSFGDGLHSPLTGLDEEKFHDSESTESAYGDEDPNDPEWVEMERTKDRFKR